MTQMDKDCDTYNKYICIYGPEIGSYCFSSNCDVDLVENVAENIYGERQSSPNIEEGNHVYHIYTFVLNADVSNRDIDIYIITQVILAF